jgi:hypothetical protein
VPQQWTLCLQNLALHATGYARAPIRLLHGVSCALQIELVCQGRVAHSLHQGRFAALRALCRERGIRAAEYGDAAADVNVKPGAYQ